jgi:hypothetical protein
VDGLYATIAGAARVAGHRAADRVYGFQPRTHPAISPLLTSTLDGFLGRIAPQVRVRSLVRGYQFDKFPLESLDRALVEATVDLIEMFNFRWLADAQTFLLQRVHAQLVGEQHEQSENP